MGRAAAWWPGDVAGRCCDAVRCRPGAVAVEGRSAGQAGLAGAGRMATDLEDAAEMMAWVPDSPFARVEVALGAMCRNQLDRNAVQDDHNVVTIEALRALEEGQRELNRQMKGTAVRDTLLLTFATLTFIAAVVAAVAAVAAL